jgi:alpha-D-ribose 1-methylphosphonate 5-triphosphate synthase subunit PhnH
MLATDFPAGFTDPVLDSQDVFRTVLHALAHPGTICDLAVMPQAPAPFTPATAALCLALFDHETPLWLQAPDTQAWLRFHCGSPIVDAPGASRFALIHDAASVPSLDRFEVGSDEYPDRSTTLILQVSDLIGTGLVLSGPGIRDSARFGVQGLREGFWDEWKALAPLFPRGIDLIFTAGSRAAALPRTTRIGG